MSVIRVNGSTTGNFPTGADVSGEVNLNVHNIGELGNVNTTGVANNSILKYDSGTSKFIIATDTDTGIAAVVDDTTPQLGGDLDLNSNNITGTGAITHTGNLTTTGAGSFSTTSDPLTTNVSSNANGTGSFIMKKTTTGPTNRGVSLSTVTDAGGSVTQLHMIQSRNFGTLNKAFKVFNLKADGSAGFQMLELNQKQGTDGDPTDASNAIDASITGRILLTIPDADDIPNSNVTTVGMDGTTVTSHNMLTGRMDFGTSSITNGSQITFTGEATNDASSDLRIGQLIFNYGTNELDNAVIFQSQEHDQTTQGKITVSGRRAQVENVPFNLPTFTTTARNALTASNGDMIYNSTDSKVQAYAGGSWVNLH